MTGGIGSVPPARPKAAKRPIHKAFEYERELRVVATDAREGASTRNDGATGLYVGVDLAKLVAEVVLAPGTPPWVLDVVRDVVERYELSAPVGRSQLDRQVL